MSESCFVCDSTEHPYWDCPVLVRYAEKAKPELKPTTLGEAILWVLSHLRDVDIKVMRHMNEEELRARIHHGFGRNMRNDLGLWEDVKPPIYTHFENLGIKHPDDISAVIFTACVRYLRREPMDLSGQVNFFKAYWEGITVETIT